MSLPSSSDKNVGPFPLSSKKEWSDAAKLELGGDDPYKKLKVRINETDILPYYDRTDLSPSGFQLPLSQNEFLGPRSWVNLPCVKVTDTKKSNEEALLALQTGADGILFDLQNATSPSALLKKIEMPYCGTVFMTGGGHENFFSALVDLVREKKYVLHELTGAIFHNALTDKPVEFLNQFKNWNQFYSLGIVAGKFSSPVEEVADLLVKAVKQMNVFTSNDEIVTRALHAVAFSVSIGADFFLEIAKLKAIRLLWFQIAKAYDPSYASHVFIHTTIPSWENIAYEPHGNMIHETTAAMSAILGGSDAITIENAATQNNMTTRVARNVSSILREESHLSKVSDPTAGSYYIETLTDQIATGAWDKFQQTVK